MKEQETTGGLTSGFLKHAWIRRADVPAGQPALGRINCPCGQAPESSFTPESGDVMCGCGTRYSWNGWIMEHGQAYPKGKEVLA